MVILVVFSNLDGSVILGACAGQKSVLEGPGKAGEFGPRDNHLQLLSFPCK